MSRGLSPAMEAASAAAIARPVLAAELDFSGGVVRVCSCPYTVTIDGEAFLGVGTFGSVSPVEEGSELQSYGIALELSGIPPELISTALGEHYQGRPCQIYLALLDEAHQVIASPVILWSGRIDTMDVDLGDSATITVSAENRLVDWERPRTRRYTNEDQRAEYPDDKGFEFVPQMQQKQLVWGRS